MRLAETDGADEDDVGVGCDEGQTEQVLDLRAIDLFWPAPLKVFQVLSTGKRACLMRRSMARFSRNVASPSISCARYSRCGSCFWAALVARSW